MRGIVVMDDRRKIDLPQFVQRVAQHRAVGWVGVSHHAVQVGHDDAGARMLKYLAKTRFADPQAVTQVFALERSGQQVGCHLYQFKLAGIEGSLAFAGKCDGSDQEA